MTTHGDYTVLAKLDGKVVERTWSFKKNIAKARLAAFVEKYSIAPENIFIDSSYLR